MFINRERLIANEKALEKYKNREVKIYCVVRNLWIQGNSFVINKEEAESMSLDNAIIKTIHYHSNVQFHFSDGLGESKPKIIDYSEEEIYNCPTISIDRHRINNMI